MYVYMHVQYISCLVHVYIHMVHVHVPLEETSHNQTLPIHHHERMVKLGSEVMREMCLLLHALGRCIKTYKEWFIAQ